MKKVSVLLFFYYSISSCRYQVAESICLLPNEFTGVVVIIFDQKKGSDPIIENGKNVYYIPSNGILKTKVKVKYITEGQQYYLIDSLGNRKSINYLKGVNNFKDNRSFSSLFIFEEEMGSTAINKPNHRTYRSFIICSPKDLDSLSNIKSRVIFDALKESN